MVRSDMLDQLQAEFTLHTVILLCILFDCKLAEEAF